tara:strand:+ start:2247 stop:2633 length:387 start_codon:yes stop_codon:yes gene_type:complete
MATNKVIFDPDAGVSFPVNLTLNSGADFTANYEVVGTSNTAFSLHGYTGSSQMQKSIGIGATTIADGTFAVGFTSAVDGKFKISMGSTATRDLSQGRYMYDILVGSGSTVYRIVEGMIFVKPGISSAP